MRFRFKRREVILPSVYGGTIAMSKMFGVELEFFLIDSEGRVTHAADEMIADVKGRLLDAEIKRESAHSMVELTSFPHISQHAVFGKFFADAETLLSRAEEKGLGLYNYSTYPGRNEPMMRSDARYKVQSRILGQREFLNTGRCVGFHYHFSLPSNSFSKDTGFFFFDLKDQKRKQILNLFNLYIAIDPALTTFMQSSPYFEGRLLGKDSRLMAYRGEPSFRFAHSAYAHYPEFATLNDYSPDFDVMLDRIKGRTQLWRRLLREQGVAPSMFAKTGSTPSPLDSSWKPVKISTHETIEQRGMDMNSLRHIAAASTLLKHLSRRVQASDITVLPSATGDDHPFLLEDGTLHVPRRERILSLQHGSAVSGLDNRRVAKHCSALMRFVKEVTPPESRKGLRVFSQELEDGRTTSDEIISFVRHHQGRDSLRHIEEETAREFALKTSERLYKDLLLTRKLFEHE